MKLQLDTTIFFHKTQNRPYDELKDKYLELKENAESIHASSYVKREYLSTLINDCCSFQSRLYITKSYYKSVEWLNNYGYFHKRYKQRIDDIITIFQIQHNRTEYMGLTMLEKDSKLAQSLCDYLRILIPELYELFEHDIDLPLDNRTHCFFGNQEPIESGEVYRIEAITSQRKCKSTYNCTVKQMLLGEKERATILLTCLKSIGQNDKRRTKELNIIQDFLEEFYEQGNTDICYDMCTKGIGDLIISLETLLDHTFVTTNYKESEIICPAIMDHYKILKKENIP